MAQKQPSFDDFLRGLGMAQNNSDGNNSGGAGSGGSGGSGAGAPGEGQPPGCLSFGMGGSKRSSKKWSDTPEQRTEKTRKRIRRFLIGLAIAAIPIILLAYWWFHPPISYYSPDAWVFVSIFILLPLFIFFRMRANIYDNGSAKVEKSKTKAKTFRRISFIPVLIVVAVIIAAIGSSVVFNAKSYAQVLDTKTSDFNTDIQEVNYSEIPIIDHDSAMRLGRTVIGSIPEYVSQFEISPLYSQINYQGHPMRVSPLLYADFFRWFANQNEGLPAYVLVDMTTQEARIVNLEQGIRYSESEPFGRNIDRHVQLSYPFYLFDQKSFEIDEDGHPWWVCPVQTRTIGLFGGTTVARVVLCDAVTGETTDLSVEECPSWVDRVYPADMLIEQYNWSGAYKDGWINSWLGQRNVVKTTPGANGQPGYNYIAQHDDVWVYTGVTSATSDESIVGFVLVNQRTAESHYYEMSGATESSAMSSAEGQVQHLGYKATFPLLLNINSQPTYFMALKDNAGLVKMYAMLNIKQYQYVAVGDTVATCQQNYLELLKTNGVEVAHEETSDVDLLTATGKVSRIATAVIEGNTHFYIVLEGDSNIYDCPLPTFFDVLTLNVGDTVTLNYSNAEGAEPRLVEKFTYGTVPDAAVDAASNGATTPTS